MDRIKEIVEAHKEGFNCAQSVLGVYAPEFQIDPATARRLASGFGGGLARRGATCGAVTGALMVIGLRQGTAEPADQEAKDRSYRLAGQFMDEFCKRNGTTQCRELLGCDISLPEGLQFARDNQLFATFCGEYVRSAAEILEEMFADEKPSR